MSEEQILSFKENVLNYNERKSYVKTIVCDILGYDENDMHNQLVGEFYDKYLKEKFTPIAIEEYQITPMVEIMLSKMSNEEQKVIGNSLLVYIENIVANYNYVVTNYDNQAIESAALMFAYMNNYLRKMMNNVGILAIDKQVEEFVDNGPTNILKKVR